jgi:hypothetical protein
LRYFSERAISLFNRTDNSLSQIYGIRLHSSPTLAIPHCPLSERKPLYEQIILTVCELVRFRLGMIVLPVSHQN